MNRQQQLAMANHCRLSVETMNPRFRVMDPLGFSSQMGFAPGSGFAYTVLTNVNTDVVSQPALERIKSYLIDRCRL